MKRGILILALIILSAAAYAQDFELFVDAPSSVDVDQEFDVYINLNVISQISNGIFIAATVPDGIKILSAQPENISG